MNVKIDETLPPELAALFIERGHSAHTVSEEGLAGHTDEKIAEHASAEGRLLVTLDRGFGDIRTYPPGTHPGMLVLRPDEQRVPVILALIRTFLQHHDLDALAGCNTIVQSSAVRIRRPA